MTSPLYKLQATIQNYAWGKLGTDSLVGRLANAKEGENTPYAELWLGSHPKAPALVVNENSTETINNLLAESPKEILGSSDLNQLSFLFKILSIGESLSIQVHPDKKTAEKLHAKSPEHYPDDNHKPEIAIAITPVTMLYGFRQVEEIKKLINSVPEISEILSESTLRDLEKTSDSVVKKIFTEIIETTSEKAKNSQENFLSRIGKDETLTKEEKWLKSLCLQYPRGDAGAFLPLVMNLFTLEKDQGLFTDANVPHAYLSGDLVECMANSDNVVRAALTPKYRDVKTLIEITEFNSGKPNILATEEVIDKVFKYKTLCDEFSIYRAEASADYREIDFLNGPIIITSHDAEFNVKTSDLELNIEPGKAVLVPSSTKEFKLKNSESDCWIAST